MCTQTITKNVVKGLLRMLIKIKKIKKKDREKTLFLITAGVIVKKLIFSFKSSVRTMLMKKAPQRISNNCGLKRKYSWTRKVFYLCSVIEACVKLWTRKNGCLGYFSVLLVCVVRVRQEYYCYTKIILNYRSC